ncbi:MAG: hypothetical protein HY053_03030 [Proteobacteria bacterium]|nr:hypothetical protein [Pseudomonadota bacterium]
MSTLATLVREAKTDPQGTAKKLLPLLQEIFPARGLTACAINTGSKVSLNSVNGTLQAEDGGHYFFKFHAEEGEEQSLADREYYQAKLLNDLRWPVITPLEVSTAPGRQCLLYEEISAATAYALFGAEDSQYLETKKYSSLREVLLRAEENYLKKTTAIVLGALQPGSTASQEAPLHQLFGHRLFGTNGATPRLDLFYTGKPVALPDGKTIGFDELAGLRWVVNGREFPHTLAEIIVLCKKLLNPSAMAAQPTAISHGDDHNGNKFLVQGAFTAFDPAFAGRHPVLLSMIKSAMHNAPLHPFWYYEPERVIGKINVDFKISAGKIELHHNGTEILKSPIREEALALYAKHAWHPVLQELENKNLLWNGWRDFVRAAGFCCPFLALNMIDPQRRPAPGVPLLPLKLPLFNLAQCLGVFHEDVESLISK